MRRIFFTVFIIGLLFLTGCVFQSGTSRDIVQGFDRGILWHHLYLKNDHKTIYCFEDERFISLLEQAQKEQKEVVVTYETYLIHGKLCSGAKEYESVIIKEVVFA